MAHSYLFGYKLLIYLSTILIIETRLINGFALSTSVENIADARKSAPIGNPIKKMLRKNLAGVKTIRLIMELEGSIDDLSWERDARKVLESAGLKVVTHDKVSEASIYLKMKGDIKGALYALYTWDIRTETYSDRTLQNIEYLYKGTEIKGTIVFSLGENHCFV